jgi:hypothetical protein
MSDDLLKQWQNLKQRIQSAGKTATANAKLMQVKAQSEKANTEAMQASNLLQKLRNLQVMGKIFD